MRRTILFCSLLLSTLVGCGLEQYHRDSLRYNAATRGVERYLIKEGDSVTAASARNNEEVSLWLKKNSPEPPLFAVLEKLRNAQGQVQLAMPTQAQCKQANRVLIPENIEEINEGKEAASVARKVRTIVVAVVEAVKDAKAAVDKAVTATEDVEANLNPETVKMAGKAALEASARAKAAQEAASNAFALGEAEGSLIAEVMDYEFATDLSQAAKNVSKAAEQAAKASDSAAKAKNAADAQDAIRQLQDAEKQAADAAEAATRINNKVASTTARITNVVNKVFKEMGQTGRATEIARRCGYRDLQIQYDNEFKKAYDDFSKSIESKDANGQRLFETKIRILSVLYSRLADTISMQRNAGPWVSNENAQTQELPPTVGEGVSSQNVGMLPPPPGVNGSLESKMGSRAMNIGNSVIEDFWPKELFTTVSLNKLLGTDRQEFLRALDSSASTAQMRDLITEPSYTGMLPVQSEVSIGCLPPPDSAAFQATSQLTASFTDKSLSGSLSNAVATSVVKLFEESERTLFLQYALFRLCEMSVNAPAGFRNVYPVIIHDLVRHAAELDQLSSKEAETRRAEEEQTKQKALEKEIETLKANEATAQNDIKRNALILDCQNRALLKATDIAAFDGKAIRSTCEKALPNTLNN